MRLDRFMYMISTNDPDLPDWLLSESLVLGFDAHVSAIRLEPS